ncbi:TetR/AcrR family transcriptional regulator [Aeromicrobium marinum]|uniref:TetR/AcrR family transcriptional regulator n=1 Tax=Aeromicrobium marinum TaxID=219314 RepID=UPI0006814A2C|nr:TetR family transcriptional regulator [Aeromicrobium marinum]
MVSRAQLSQERSRQRRDALLAAAIELFAEGGSRLVTHRAVAARAGVAPATTTYYFASIDDLIREALAAHVQQWIDDLRGFTVADLGAAVPTETAAGWVEMIFAARGPEVAAVELSIYLAAARDPQLRDVAGEALRSLEQLAADVLRHIGVEDSRELVAAIIALIAGTALRRQSGQYSESEEALMLTTAVRHLVRAHAAPGGSAAS